MKKTIVVIILAVYIASIAIVNFFGLEVKIFDGITYVSSIQCDSITFLGNNGEKIAPSQFTGKNYDIPLFIFDFIPPDPSNPYTTEADSITNNPNIIQIDYEILPHDAPNGKDAVKFEYDEAAGVAVFHDLSTSFIFLKPNKLFTITIKATDGSNVSTQICVMARMVESNP